MVRLNYLRVIFVVDAVFAITDHAQHSLNQSFFLRGMDASNKQPTVAEKFAAVWEKKNAKAARAGGVSLMALSLAACGSSSDDTTASTSTSTSTDTTTTTVTAVNKVFTTGFDTLEGGAGDDSFSGLQANGGATETLSSFDSVDGGAGTDTLIIANSTANAFAGPDITSIETVEYRATAAGADLDFDEIAGATTVTLKGTTGATDFTDVLTTQTLTILDSGASLDTNITYKASTVEGAADSATVIMDNAGNSDAGDIELSGAVETITINAVGDDTRIDDLDLDATTTTLNVNATAGFRVDTAFTAAGVTTINVTGAGVTRFDDGGAAVTTFDASATTGGVYAVFDETTNVTATGGTGDDTFDFAGTLTKNDVIDGGDGADTLIVLPGATINGDLQISNIETLRLGDVTGSNTLDMDNVAGVTAVRITDGTASNITTLRDIATSIATINYTGAGSVTANSAFDTVVTDYDATADIALLTVNITNGGTTTTGDVEIVTGSEFDGANKVVINASDWGTGTGDVVTLNTINADSANEIVVTSNTDVSVTIAGMGGAAAADRLETVDFSGSDAGITLTISSDDDATVTLGDGNDDFNGGDGDETIDAGAGNDTIEGDAGADTMTGGTGIDTFDIAFGGEGADTITDFTAGAGGDVIDFSGSSDVGGNVTNATTFAIQGNANNTSTQLVNGFTVIDNNDGTNTNASSLAVGDVATYLADTDGAGAGTDAITVDNAGTTDDAYIVVSDGTDSAIYKVAHDDGDGTIDSDELTLIVTLEGISDAGTLTAANFADFI